MITCPKCGCQECVKDGIVKEKQRYRCKRCNFRHTVQHRGKGPEVMRQALVLYLEGLGFRSIGRFLQCSHVTVYNWIKSFGEKVVELRSGSDLKVVEIDEMHTFISSKKITAGSGLLLIDMEKDSSTAYWATVAQKPASNYGTPCKTKKSSKS